MNPQDIATAILAAPGWARVGITAPRAELREDAARELARAIVAGELGQVEEPGLTDAGQYSLAL